MDFFFSSVITLCLVMDPFGNIPLFVSALKKVAPERRKNRADTRTAYRHGHYGGLPVFGQMVFANVRHSFFFHEHCRRHYPVYHFH